jgi:hypothetical protein
MIEIGFILLSVLLLVMGILLYINNLLMCKKIHKLCKNYFYPTFDHFSLSIIESHPNKTLKEIAENLSSEFVFLISSNGLFSYIKESSNLELKKPIKDELIKKASTDEVYTDEEDGIPEVLKKNGIKALINVPVGFPNTEVRLIICTNKKLNKKEQKTHYELREINLAMIMGRALPIDLVRKIINEHNSRNNL